MKRHMNGRKHQAFSSFPCAQVKILRVTADSSLSLTLYTYLSARTLKYIQSAIISHVSAATVLN